MRARAVVVAATSAILFLMSAPTSTAATSARSGTTICTWGGTPADATGTFNMRPGVTNTPSTGPINFVARGELAGAASCHGTVTFIGAMQTGATCAAQVLEGRVKGLPGVVAFRGEGAAGMVHEFLYDRAGNV